MINIEPIVVVLVLFAAAMHPAWNALLSSGGNQLVKTQLLILMYVVVGILFLCFFANSTVPDIIQRSWPWLIASAIGHILYYLGLGQSYRSQQFSRQEFSAVYGVMRGLGPVFITIGAALLFGQWLTPFAILAIVMVSAGAFLLKWSGVSAASQVAFIWAIVTAVGSAISILADGSGVLTLNDRLGFYGCSLVGGGISSLVVFAILGIRWTTIPNEDLVKGIAAGLLSVLTYSIGIWAITVHPFGKIAALRETSVLFGLVYGRVFFKEKEALNSKRVLGCIVVALGAGILVWLKQ